MIEENVLFVLLKLFCNRLKEFLCPFIKHQTRKPTISIGTRERQFFQPNTDEPIDSGPSLCHGIPMTNSIIRCDPLRWVDRFRASVLVVGFAIVRTELRCRIRYLTRELSRTVDFLNIHRPLFLFLLFV